MDYVHWETLNEELIADWRKSERGLKAPKAVADAFRSAAEAHAADPDALVPDIKVLFNEACWRVVTGYLPQDSLTHLLKSHDVVNVEAQGLALPFADVLWGLGMQLSRGEKHNIDDNDEWDALCKLVAAIAEEEVIPKNVLKTVLELDLIEGSRLMVDVTAFNNKMKKRNTSAVYKQQKYNLLNEESEGFAKMLVQINSSDLVPYAVLKENVLSLIGYFDLDPNRCFDLVLEGLEHDLTNVSLLKLVSEFRTTSLAHIVGFKFAFHSKPSSRARTPQSLYRLAGLLIASGKLQLEDLLPHLSPDPAKAAATQKEQTDALIKEASELGIVSIGGDGDAGKASDRSKSSGKSTSKQATENQHFGLLAALLQLHVIDHAKKFVELLEEQGLEPSSSPVVRQALRSVLHYLLGEVAPSLSPVAAVKAVQEAQAGKAKAGSASSAKPQPKPKPKPKAQQEELEEGEAGEVLEGDSSEEGEFEGSEHSEAEAEGLTGFKVKGSVQPASSVKEALTRMPALLEMLGPWLHEDGKLFTRVCRVLAAYTKANKAAFHADSAPAQSSEKATESKEAEGGAESSALALREAVLECLELYVMPNLALTPASTGANFEVWSVLSHLPYEMRYGVYDGWVGEGLQKQGIGKKHPLVSLAEMKAGNAIRRHLRRVAKENVYEYARVIAVLAHSHPLVVMDEILNKMQAYINFIEPLTECLKFFTAMSFDVVGYTLVTKLAQERPLMNKTGLTVASWLQNLAIFAGGFYSKYPTVELHGLLNFLVGSLRQGGEKAVDVVVLKELLDKAGGIELLEDVSGSQLEGKAGGESLRTETIAYGVTARANPRAVHALQEAFVKSNLALPLVVLVAQQRKAVLFAEAGMEGRMKLPDPPLKLVGLQYDTLHTVLVQLVEFLALPAMSVKWMVSCPSLSELVNDYKLEPAVAFAICRPLLRHALLAKWGVPFPSNSNFKSREKKEKGKTKEKEKDNGEEKSGGMSPDMLAKWDPSSPDVVETVTKLMSEDDLKVMTPEVYVHFWVLELYDVWVPTERYKTELHRLREKYSHREALKGGDRADARKHKSEADHIALTIHALEKEQKDQNLHIREIKKHLAASKATLFPKQKDLKGRNLTALGCVASLVHPRLCWGAEHAVYADKFFALMHSIGVDNFSTIYYYNKVFDLLCPALNSATEYEASAMGCFLQCCFTRIRRWRDDSAIYKKEAEARPGFLVDGEVGEDPSPMPHDLFVTVADNYAPHLTRSVIACLGSTEYMTVKTALVALTRVIEVYPWMYQEGLALEKELAKIVDNEQREDIRIKAMSTLTKLKSKMPDMLLENGKKKGKPPKKRKAPPGGQGLTSNEQELLDDAAPMHRHRDVRDMRGEARDIRGEPRDSRAGRDRDGGLGGRMGAPLKLSRGLEERLGGPGHTHTPESRPHQPQRTPEAAKSGGGNRSGSNGAAKGGGSSHTSQTKPPAKVLTWPASSKATPSPDMASPAAKTAGVKREREQAAAANSGSGSAKKSRDQKTEKEIKKEAKAAKKELKKEKEREKEKKHGKLSGSKRKPADDKQDSETKGGGTPGGIKRGSSGTPQEASTPGQGQGRKRGRPSREAPTDFDRDGKKWRQDGDGGRKGMHREGGDMGAPDTYRGRQGDRWAEDSSPHQHGRDGGGARDRHNDHQGGRGGESIENMPAV
ncbi:unnamed protein product [Chrysoparadoxa australica]